MLLLSKLRVMRSALKSRYVDSRRIRWWLKDQNLIPVARSVVSAVRDVTKQAGPPSIKAIKASERKVVFRMDHPLDAQQSFIAKVFLLNRLEHRLKYHRYGLDEAANLLRAKARGVNTPDVYGYGHIYDILGLVKVSIIILEDLRGLSPIRELMCTKSQDECSRIFMRTVPLFAKLYEAGCNHIDVNSGAVMLSEDHLDSKVSVLDFQHAKFYSTPSNEILMFEAGHFAKSCSDCVPRETIDEWLATLLDTTGIRDTALRAELIERFNYYFSTYLSRKERRKIR